MPIDTLSGSQIKTIVQGDSYDGIANAKLTWAVADDLTTWTGEFVVTHRTTGEELLSVTATAVSTVLVEVSLSSANTAFTDLVSDDEFGPHFYRVRFAKDGSQVTVVPAGVVVIEKNRSGE